MMTMAIVCTRCVLDTTDPDISFDGDGVCSHCRRYDMVTKPIVAAAARGERLADLDREIERIKTAGRGRQYDCVIGVSGGVDSTYVLLQASRRGLRPLAVHFDSGWNSELAVGNIEQATKVLGVDLITQVVDWPQMRDLQLAFFRAGVPNCDIPQDHAFPAIALRTCATRGIRYNLTGYNFTSESMLPTAWGYRSGDLKHLRAIYRQFGAGGNLNKFPTLGMFKKDIWYPHVRRIKNIALLNYLDYHKDLAKKEIIEEVGWRDYGGKHYESVFTRFFQGVYLPEKFGYDKRRSHYSSLIASGQMKRDEALAALEQPTYDPVLQAQDKAFVSKKLGITIEEMNNLIMAPNRRHEEFPTLARRYELAFVLRDKFRSSRAH